MLMDITTKKDLHVLRNICFILYNLNDTDTVKIYRTKQSHRSGYGTWIL